MEDKEIQGVISGIAKYGWSARRAEHFVALMAQQHRTEQQDFTRLCVAWLEYIAQNDRCDDRNRASVELAKAFVKDIPARTRAMPRI